MTAHQNKIWTLNDLINDSSVAPPAIVGDGVLLSDSLLLIVGSPKVGKSFLAMNMALAIAGGKGFAGFRIERPERVLLLSAEGGHYPNRERLRVMSRRFDRQDPVTENFAGSFDVRWRIDDGGGLSRLRRMITEFDPRVVVLDPLVRFHGADENSAKEMAGVFTTLRTLMSDYNLSVILVHHQGKSSWNGARGSSVITGEYDSCIELKRNQGAHTLAFDMRHVESPGNRAIEFSPQKLWFDAVGRNPIVEILLEIGRPLDKSEIVKMCVKRGHNTRSSNAYNRINKAVRDGIIIENGNKTFSLPEWKSRLSTQDEDLERRRN